MSTEDVIDNAALAETMADDTVEGFFEKGKHKGGMYLSVFDGSICQRSKVEIEGWDHVETTNQTTKETVHSWVHRFDRVVARIIDIDKEKVTFTNGNSVTNYNIILMAGNKRAVLQLQYMDSVLKRFLKVAPNINFDRPILISAWSTMKEGKKKQAVSFRQGEGKDVDKWVKVEEFWKTPRDKDGNILGPSTAPDQSVMPQPVQDEDDDTWDYKAQNKFLVGHFRENVLPKIKVIAEKYGHVEKAQNDGASTPEFSGLPSDAAPAVDPSVKPTEYLATQTGLAMSGEQTAQIKALCKQIGVEPEAVVQKLLNTSLHLLNTQGAAYILYKLTKKLAKMKAEGKIKEAPAPPPPPPAPVAPASEDDEDDEWGLADTPTPAPAVTAPQGQPDDDDDDIPF